MASKCTTSQIQSNTGVASGCLLGLLGHTGETGPARGHMECADVLGRLARLGSSSSPTPPRATLSVQRHMQTPFRTSHPPPPPARPPSHSLYLFHDSMAGRRAADQRAQVPRAACLSVRPRLTSTSHAQRIQSLRLDRPPGRLPTCFSFRSACSLPLETGDQVGWRWPERAPRAYIMCCMCSYGC